MIVIRLTNFLEVFLIHGQQPHGNETDDNSSLLQQERNGEKQKTEIGIKTASTKLGRLINKLKMKYLVLFALVGLMAARPDGEDRPHPDPRGPAIFVRPVHKVAQNESYEFRFGIAGMKELNESEVSLWKVVKGEEGPELKETDFDVQLKTLNEDEIKEWWEKKEEERKEDDEDDKQQDDDRRPKPRPRPHPRPHFKHAIIGHVSVSVVSCDHQGPYLVKYGSESDDEENEEEEDKEERHRRPHGAFYIFVKGCKRPEPRDN
ncbi:hypothetical protein ACHWQZ_G016713 [Mnemiopsis leidyi]